MIYGIGTDIIEINRIILGLQKSYFLDKLFTEAEQEYMKSKRYHPQVVAGSFAAKEAVVKALGVGFSCFSIKEIEILRNMQGKPYVRASGKAKQFMQENRIYGLHISISHGKEYATAVAVAEQEDKL